jgi:hypothetical protein
MENQTEKIIKQIYQLVVESYHTRRGVVELTLEKYSSIERGLHIWGPNLSSTPLWVCPEEFRNGLLCNKYKALASKEDIIFQRFINELIEILHTTGYGEVILTYKNRRKAFLKRSISQKIDLI